VSSDEPTRQGDSAHTQITQRKLQLERLCTEFERIWQSDTQPGIREFLEGVDPALHAEIVVELVVMECELQEAANDLPRKSDYHERLPQWKSQVDEAFAAWSNDRLGDTIVEHSGRSFGQAPEQVGEFRILRQIGEGGMGVVYEAVQESLGRHVAVKVLTRPNIIGLLTRFQREARAVAMLHHTNIVEVFGSGTDNDVPYIAMQLIDGCGLDDVIEDARAADANDESDHGHKSDKTNIGQSTVVDLAKDSLRPGTLARSTTRVIDSSLLEGARGNRYVAKIGLQVAEALRHAHEHGVLHRDIKPANLLIDNDGNVSVSDFGLAKLNNDESDVTVDGNIIGTLRYLPPEAFGGQWDERADVYSLGATIYEALALRPAFDFAEHAALIERISSKVPAESLRKLNSQIPLDLETIVSKAMSPEAGSRYQSAGLLADDLRRYINGQPILARRASVPEKIWKWSKRKPALAALLTLIAAVASIGFPSMAVLWQRAEVARADAEQQEEFAVESASEARAAESEAREAEGRAKTAAAEARVAEAEALDRKRQAEEATEASEIARYGSSMMLAQKYMEEGKTYDLTRLLNEWVPDTDAVTDDSAIIGEATVDRRGWEWNYLKQNTNASTLSMRGMFPYIWDVAVSPDDTQIAAAFGNGVNNLSNRVIVWDSVTGKALYELHDPHCNIKGVAYSPDGTILATIGHVVNKKDTRGTLTLWDASTGKKKRFVKLPGQYNDRYISGGLTFNYPATVAFSADGEQLLVTPNPIAVYDTQTLKPIWKAGTFEGDEAVFGKDGQIVTHGDTKIHVYDQATGKSIATEEQADLFGCLRCSNDRSVFTSMTKTTVKMFTDSNWVKPRDISSQGISWGSVSPDGRWILTGSRAGAMTIRPLDDATQQPIRFLGHTSEISDAAFSHDGTWFVTASLDGSVKKWSIASLFGSAAFDTQVGHVSAIAFRDDGRTVVCAGVVSEGETSASAVSVSGESSVVQALPTTINRTWPRTDFAFSHDGTLLAAPYKEDKTPSGSSDAHSRKVGVWSTADWRELGQIEVGMHPIQSIYWSKDNGLLAVGGGTAAGHRVKVYRVDPGGFMVELVAAIPAPARILSLAFRDDLLAVSCGKGISIWNSDGDSGDGDVKFTKVSDLPQDRSVIYMDLSPKADRLALTHYSGGSFAVIDVATGQTIYERQGPRNGRCIRFSPDGSRLAIVGHDAHVHLCDAKTGTQLLNLAGSTIPAGMANLDARVIFSPDGNRIATHNLQGQIKIWEVSPDVRFVD